MLQIFVFFTDEKSVGIKTMRKCVCVLYNPSNAFSFALIRLVNILEEKNIQQGIIVFPGNMTPSARKVC